MWERGDTITSWAVGQVPQCAWLPQGQPGSLVTNMLLHGQFPYTLEGGFLASPL